MVFSSLPAYHHDPANWQQQPNHPNIITSSAGMSGGSQLLQPSAPSPLPPPPPPPLPHGGGGAGSIRPGSMADRARMANIPMPETALKCPRCESANTKFCYFNNYSLTQPRHFCKTCRRYWTRGGALRNVPVGGGCRRNKRTKGSGGSSKSPVSSSDRQTGSMTTSGSSGAVPSGNNNLNSDILGLAHQVPPGLRFMTPLHHQLTHHHHDFAAATSDNLGFSYGGLNYGSMSAPMVGGADLSFHIGSSALSGGGGGTGPSSLLTGFEQWRMQQPPQFPFMASGLDPASAGLFESQGGDGPGYQPRPKLSSSAITHQMASVKMEDNNHHHHHHHHHQQQQQQHELNLSRQLMGNDQYWNGGGGGGGGGGGNSGNNAWTTDPSGFSSSSTTSNQL